MAFLFADSYDHFATATINQKYGSTQLTGGFGSNVAIGAFGRNGTNAARFTYFVSNANLYIQTSHPLTPVTGTTAIAGVALQMSGPLPVQDWNSIISFMNPGGSAVQCSLRVNVDLSLSVMRGSSLGTVLASTAPILSFNTFYYLELKADINTTTGSYELRVNEVPMLTGTGVNTAAAGTNNWASCRLGTNSTNCPVAGTWDWDDFYLLDGSGSSDNDFYGDVSIRAHFPNAPGTYAEWTRGGTDSGVNWDQENEIAANSDTDYVSGTITGTKDTYNFEALKAPGQTILGLQAVAQAEKIESGTASVGAIYRHAGTDSIPLVGTAVSYGAYLFCRQHNPVNPVTGLAWTESDFNALEAGPYKVT